MGNSKIIIKAAYIYKDLLNASVYQGPDIIKEYADFKSMYAMMLAMWKIYAYER